MASLCSKLKDGLVAFVVIIILWWVRPFRKSKIGDSTNTSYRALGDDEFKPSAELIKLFLRSSAYSVFCGKYFGGIAYLCDRIFRAKKLAAAHAIAARFISDRIGMYLLGTVAYRAQADGIDRVYVSDGTQFIATGKNGLLFMSDTVYDGFIQRYGLVRNAYRVLLVLHTEIKEFVRAGGKFGGKHELRLDQAGCLYIAVAHK